MASDLIVENFPEDLLRQVDEACIRHGLNLRDFVILALRCAIDPPIYMVGVRDFTVEKIRELDKMTPMKISFEPKRPDEAQESRSIQRLRAISAVAETLRRAGVNGE